MSDKIFIIDTDALIHAYRYDFPPDGDHGGFWEWLDELAQSFDIFIPEKVLEEIKTGISHINSKCKNPHTSLLLVPMI